MQLSGIATVLVLVSLAACQPSGPAALSEEDITAIEATSQAFLKAARASDWAAAAATYTDDAVLMPPNGPPVEGRANIQAWMESFPPFSDIDLSIVEIDGLGDLAYVRGTYKMTITPEGQDPIVDSGKFLEIRRKQADGSWLFTRDMFSSDLALSQ